MWDDKTIFKWVCASFLVVASAFCAASGETQVTVKNPGTRPLSRASRDSTHRDDPRDLLDLRKLTKKLDLSSAQQDSASQVIGRLRDILEAFEWDIAKMSCEAPLWKEGPPNLDAIKARRRRVRLEVEALLQAFRGKLDADQQARLDGMMWGLERLLSLHLNEKIPFSCIETRPIFGRVDDQRETHPITFTDAPHLDSLQSYADVLKAWTTKAFWSDPDLGATHIAEDPAWDIQENYPVLKRRLARSPLIVAATLMSPDLVEAEVRHLHQYYNPEGRSLDAIRTSYHVQNRIGETILIRLKMGTPYAAPYLSLKNWLIYIEDDAGDAYEPTDAQEQPIRPIEAVPLEIPGNTYEAVYQIPPPGLDPSVNRRHKIFWADEPENIVYVGHEAHVKLFFPIRRRDGSPLVSPETQFLKFIIKPAGGENGGRVMIWWFKKRGFGPAIK